MNWGKSIMLVFILFATFIGVLVTVCIKQDVSLVSPDYYQDELAYQSQIDRLNNTELLTVKPITRFIDNSLEVRYTNFSSIERGELKLFRPSDLRYDKTFSIHSTGDSIQRFNIDQLPAGMYKTKITWVMDGKEYYVENIINL